jgi:AcrR family transcriptional regulator
MTALTGNTSVKSQERMASKPTSPSAETALAVLSPRERILAAACDLFYREGIRAVGVDAIAAAAGTNKMTLYRHFESKDLLVAEYLRQLARKGEAIWDQLTVSHPGDPDAQIEAWLNYIESMLSDCAERGCALANAAIEIPDKDHPARQVIESYKKRQRERFVALCRDAGFTEPDRLADEIHLLFKGARVSLQSVGLGGPASRLVKTLRSLLAEHPRQAKGASADS